MEEPDSDDHQDRDRGRNNGMRGFGNLTEAEMRAILDVRNASLMEQIESLQEQIDELAQQNPSLMMRQYYVKLQMKFIYIYMYCVNHENRYILDRMTHICWVLALLVLFQFHLLHISSFSFINCMSEQIVESLENPQMNHTYEMRAPSGHRAGNRAKHADIGQIEAELDTLNISSLPIAISKINTEVFLSDILQNCSGDQEWEETLRYHVLNQRMQNHMKLQAPSSLTKRHDQQLVANHTYFRDFFEKSTDIYFFRIVDQMAQMNHETAHLDDDRRLPQNQKNSSSRSQQHSAPLYQSVPAYASPTPKVQHQKSGLSYHRSRDLETIKRENMGYYEVTDSDLSQMLAKSKMNRHLPIQFPMFSKSEILLAHASSKMTSSSRMRAKIEKATGDQLINAQQGHLDEMSQILQDEMLGLSNGIFSEDKNDILWTIRILNDTYINSHHHFLKLVDHEIKTTERNTSTDSSDPFTVEGSVYFDYLKTWRTIRRACSLASNFLSAKLMNDNFYAFSYNQTLLDLPPQELAQVPDLRVKYIQVNSMNKCVPQDWFLAYDQFAVYTFLNLAGQRESEAGYLKTYFRPQKSHINLLNNLEVLNVDYGQDFKGDFLTEDGEISRSSYFAMRLKALIEAMFDMILMHTITYLVSNWLRALVYSMCKHDDRIELNVTRIAKLCAILFIMRMLPLSLTLYDHFQFSANLIAYITLFYHNFAIYLLVHSSYCTKYYFYMFLSTFMYYYYLKTYPYSNVTLTNIVYVTFSGYQLAHNLFKLCFQFELMILTLNRGNLAVLLPASIQNTLQRRFTARQFQQRRQEIERHREEQRQRAQQRERERAEQREQEQRRLEALEAERHRRAREEFAHNREIKLKEMEAEFREQAMMMRRAAGMGDGPESQQHIEQEVTRQMAAVRSIVQSNRYQDILEQFSTLINKPQEIIRSLNQLEFADNHSLTGQNDSGVNRDQNQQINSCMRQFKAYTNEVNRQISNIAEVLNEVTAQNALLVSKSQRSDTNPSDLGNTQNQISNQRSRLEGDVPDTIDSRNEEAEQLCQDASDSSEIEDLVCENRLLSSIGRDEQPLDDSKEEEQPPCAQMQDSELMIQHNDSICSALIGQQEEIKEPFRMDNESIYHQALTPQQKRQLKCGCSDCKKLFDASQRWVQDQDQRIKDLEGMNNDDLELQRRILQKQLSTIIELIGVTFILERPNRDRRYEQALGGTSLYTYRHILIDDVNELCEVLAESKRVYVNQRVLQDVSDEEADLRNQEILNKVQAIDYQVTTLDQIYQKAGRSSHQRQNNPRQSMEPEQHSMHHRMDYARTMASGPLTQRQRASSRRQQHIDEQIRLQQDHLPVVQVFIVNTSGDPVNNCRVKQIINFKEPQQVNMDASEWRHCEQNPTYIVTFSRLLPNYDLKEAIDQRIEFVAKEVQQICRESLWADPCNQDTAPPAISLITQSINRKLKQKYGESTANEVHIERLCMKPLVEAQEEDKEAERSEQQARHENNVLDQDMKPQGAPSELKYGADKDVQTSIIHLQNGLRTQKSMNIATRSSGGGPASRENQSWVKEETKQASHQITPTRREQEAKSSSTKQVLQSQNYPQVDTSNLRRRSGPTGQSGQGNEAASAAQVAQLLQQLVGQQQAEVPPQSQNQWHGNLQRNAREAAPQSFRTSVPSLDQLRQGHNFDFESLLGQTDSPNGQESETVNMNQINTNLMILQNQIQQAAYVLRSEIPDQFDEHGNQKQRPLTDEQIANNPSKRKQIEGLKNMFFNDLTTTELLSSIQVASMNKDERIFFKAMVNQNQDMVRLFPALYPLNSQFLILYLIDEQDKAEQRRQALIQLKLQEMSQLLAVQTPSASQVTRQWQEMYAQNQPQSTSQQDAFAQRANPGNARFAGDITHHQLLQMLDVPVEALFGDAGSGTGGNIPGLGQQLGRQSTQAERAERNLGQSERSGAHLMGLGERRRDAPPQELRVSHDQEAAHDMIEPRGQHARGQQNTSNEPTGWRQRNESPERD